jgi:hypothetical protein
MASVMASIPSSQLSNFSPEEASTILTTMARTGAVANAPEGTMDHILKSLITTALLAQDESLTMAFTATARMLHSLSFNRGSPCLRTLLSSSSIQRGLLDVIENLPRKRGQSSQQLDGIALLLQAIIRCNLNLGSGELSDQISNAIRTRLASANASSLLSLTATVSSAFSSPSSSLHHLLNPLTQSALLTSASELSLAEESRPSIGPGLVSLLVAAVRSKRSLPGLLRRLLALLSWYCVKSTSHGSTALNQQDISMALWSLSRLQYRRVHQIRSPRAVDTSAEAKKHLWGSLNKSRRLILGRGRRGRKLDSESFLVRAAWSEWPEWTDALRSVSNSIHKLQEVQADAQISWDTYSITRSLMSLSMMGASRKKNRIWMMLSPNALQAFIDESQEKRKQKGPSGAKRFMLGEQQKRHAVKLCVAKVVVSLLPCAISLSSYDSWCLTTLFRSLNGLVDLERMQEGSFKVSFINSHRLLPPLGEQMLRRILAGGLVALAATKAQQPASMVWGSRQLVIVASSIFMLEKKTTRKWAEAFAKAVETCSSHQPMTMTAAGTLSLLHCCQGLINPDTASCLFISINQDELGIKCLWQRQVLSLIQSVTDHGIMHRPGILPILLKLIRPRIQRLSRAGGSLPYVIEHVCLSSTSDKVVLIKGKKARQMLFTAVIRAIRGASRIDQLLVLARGVTLHLPDGVISSQESDSLADVAREMKVKAVALREMMRVNRWSGQRQADEHIALIDVEQSRWMAI